MLGEEVMVTPHSTGNAPASPRYTHSQEILMPAPRVAILENRVGEHLAGLIAKQGATPFWAPALAEEPDIDPPAIRALVESFASVAPHLAIFQTGVGTKALFDTCDQLGLTNTLLRALESASIAVRGPKPTAELRRRNVRIDLSAAEPYTTHEVLSAIASLDLQGKNVLVQRYGESNAELDGALKARGARVTEVPTYRWALPRDTAPLIELMDRLQRKEFDAVVFTSASQAKNLFALALQHQRDALLREHLNATLVVSIGPVCSHALAEYGVRVGLEASPPKLGPLLSQLQSRLAADSSVLK
jgi:uroporphyrinogen-III synthase